MMQTNQFIYYKDLVHTVVGKAAMDLITAQANADLFAQALNALVNHGFKEAKAGGSDTTRKGMSGERKSFQYLPSKHEILMRRYLACAEPSRDCS